MQLKVVLPIALVFSVVGCNSGGGTKPELSPDDYVSATQIEALFSDKRFEGTNHNTGKGSYNVSKSDGTMSANVFGGPTWDIKWWVNDIGQHCLNHPRFGESCGEIVDVGGGVYYRMVKGRKANTYEKFSAL